MPSFPDQVQPLHGQLVALRLAAERDIPEILIAHQDDPELHALLGEQRPPSGAQLGRRAEGELAERRAGERLRFTIVAAGADECLGQLEVDHVEWDHGRAELCVWLAPGARGRGLAAEALALAAGWLLGDQGFARVELLVGPAGERAGAAAVRAGFTPEGVLRGYRRAAAGRVDATVRSLVAADLERAT
jgi:RimJ/RimL family protein N-acetyltransferase